MSSILVTGGGGFLGSRLVPLLAEKHKLYLLVRSKEKAQKQFENLAVQLIKGDITAHYSRWEELPQIDEVYHLAGLLSLSSKDREGLYRINTDGTLNIRNFCLRNKVKRLIHVSTSYIGGDSSVFRESDFDVKQSFRNEYEKSKFWGEAYLREYSFTIPCLVFRPSIIIGQGGTEGFHRFVNWMGRVTAWHAKAEKARKRVERTLHLPPIRGSFRIRGEPEVRLNLVPVDWVTEKMLEIAETHEEGTFHLTNSNAPKLSELAEWVGERLDLDIEINPNARLLPFEMVFERAARDFMPYLKTDLQFETSLEPPKVDRELILRVL